MKKEHTDGIMQKDKEKLFKFQGGRGGGRVLVLVWEHRKNTHRNQHNEYQLLCLLQRTAHFFNPHQNDQGRKGPCCFQRLIALKCLKCQKIKKNI
jgi:hypothetical protein